MLWKQSSHEQLRCIVSVIGEGKCTLIEWMAHIYTIYARAVAEDLLPCSSSHTQPHKCFDQTSRSGRILLYISEQSWKDLETMFCVPQTHWSYRIKVTMSPFNCVISETVSLHIMKLERRSKLQFVIKEIKFNATYFVVRESLEDV